MPGEEPVSVSVSLCCDAINDKWCREKWTVEITNTGGDSSAKMMKSHSLHVRDLSVFLSSDAIDPPALFTPLILTLTHFAKDQNSQERNYC